MDQHTHPDSVLIDALGGSVETARMCRVTSQAVSQWRRYGIPESRRMYLQLLRPDVFGEHSDSDHVGQAA